MTGILEKNLLASLHFQNFASFVFYWSLVFIFRLPADIQVQVWTEMEVCTIMEELFLLLFEKESLIYLIKGWVNAPLHEKWEQVILSSETLWEIMIKPIHRLGCHGAPFQIRKSTPQYLSTLTFKSTWSRAFTAPKFSKDCYSTDLCIQLTFHLYLKLSSASARIWWWLIKNWLFLLWKRKNRQP